MQEAPPQPPAASPPGPPSAGERCAVCGTPAEQGQEFCLSCGNRLAAHYRRPPSWRLIAGVAAAAVVALGAGVGAAIGLSSGGHDKSPVQTTTTTTQGAAPPAAPTTAPPVATPTATTPAKPGTVTTAPGAGGTPGPTPGKPTTPAIPGAAVWPPGKQAYTPSSKEAKAKAKAAIAKGVPAGILQSNAYQTLPPGLYVVFAGQYATAKQATAAANGYASKGFGSAYGRLIQPKA